MLDQTDRNLGMDLVRATEAGALKAGNWVGLGEGRAADEAASRAMFDALNTLEMDGRIIVGEERKLGNDTCLCTEAKVGTGRGPQVDVVVDAVDGTRLLMNARSGAMSVVAVAPAGSMWSPSPAVYMQKVVVDREIAAGLVTECLEAPPAWTLALIARLKKKPIRELVVFVLERSRHKELVEEIRQAGARVWLRADGDIVGAVMAATPGLPVDVMMGIGGIAEGMIAACAVRALGGRMLGRLAPQSDSEAQQVAAAGLDVQRVLTCDELVASRKIYFAATGITDGGLLQGVTYDKLYARTDSMILRGETGTRRRIVAEHLLDPQDL